MEPAGTEDSIPPATAAIPAREQSSLRIQRIEVIPVRVPLDRVFAGSHYSMRNRCTIITRIYTSEGLTGECYNGDADAEQPLIVGIIEREIAPRLVGLSGWNVQRCWEVMFDLTRDILRDRAPVLQAMACVDSALMDLIGKAVGTPLRRLWGGYRDELPLIAIAGYYSDDPRAIEQDAQSFRDLGLAGCKFKVGGRSPAEDAERVRELRNLMGPDFVIAADANQGYSVEEAVQFARLSRDCGLVWFEEPCVWSNDRLAMRDVRYTAGVRIAAGQSETSVAGARDLMVAGAIDVCNFDASWGGGPTPWLSVAGMASAFGVKMGHHEEPQIAAQLLSAIPHGTYLECFVPERDPIFWGMIANRGPIVDGRYQLNFDPGWGLTLDQDFVRRYRAD